MILAVVIYSLDVLTTERAGFHWDSCGVILVFEGYGLVDRREAVS